MPTTWETFPIEFTGGLISNQSPLQQGINSVGSATTLQNYEPAKSGGYRKIKGYAKAYPAAVSGTGAVLGVAVINATKALAIRSNGTVTEYWRNSGAGWVSTGIAGALGGRTRASKFNFNGTDKVVFVDGVNAPAVYNTATDALVFLTSAPAEVLASTSVAEFKNHMFYAKGDLLSFSAPFDETHFMTGAGAGTVRVGSAITGLTVFRDTLIIFSQNRISQLVGSSVTDFTLKPITEDIGCIDGFSIQEVGGDIMYLSPDGLRLLSATDRNNDFSLEVASDPIPEEAVDFLNSGGLFCSLVVREKAQYRIFSYLENEVTSVAKGLLATKFSNQGATRIEWATLKGFKVSACDGSFVGDVERILFGSDSGFVYALEEGFSFDGANIEALYESPYMPIQDPQIRKSFYKITLYVTPTGALTLSCNVKYDFGRINGQNVIQPPQIQFAAGGNAVFIYGASTATYGTAVYGGQLDSLYTRMMIGSGRTISLRFEESSTNPPHTLDSAIIEFKPLDRQ